MNDEARDILAAAALRGHKQATGIYHDDDMADCALGVLHLTLHETRDEAISCAKIIIPKIDGTWAPHAIIELQQRYDISARDWHEISTRNDYGQDFLTISRKTGSGDTSWMGPSDESP